VTTAPHLRDTEPLVASTRAELATALAATRSRGGRVALVPTMGALHAGHAALVDEARASVADDDAVVVSVFVNPLQFRAGEDLDRYPRTLEADVALCADHGADVVFVPTVAEIYPGGDPQVTVDPGALGAVLEGAVRPEHFRGVLTVVAKLLGLVRPDVAVFGQKDFQQLVLVRRMVEDLCLGTIVVGAETVREPMGLALSSRNAYLDPAQVRTATLLYRCLRAGAAAGERGAAAVEAAARTVLDGVTGLEPDYVALTAPDLGPAPAHGEARLLVAARVGTTRLIDNVAVHLEDAGGAPGARR
jgi:pantoate--beta-alanine ligase